LTTISELLAAMPDAEAVDEHWRRICREMVTKAAAEAYERGLRDGHLATVATLKRAQHEAVEHLDAYLSRWHVCCQRCRLEGHQEGCPDCQARTRETFGDPLPGDLTSEEMLARARASWEPYGLGPGPGWVHLGGQAVHHHRRCTAACYAYRPGWYPVAEAIAIIETLPGGGYAGILAELREQAGAASGRTAA
jgi:hypothetical protein